MFFLRKAAFSKRKILNVVGQKLLAPTTFISGSHNATFIVPADVTSICAVVIGRGANSSSTNHAGAGGGLSYRNDIPVTPGESLTMISDTGSTRLLRGTEILVIANAGSGLNGGKGGKNASAVNTGGGDGGEGGYSNFNGDSSGGTAGRWGSKGASGSQDGSGTMYGGQGSSLIGSSYGGAAGTSVGATTNSENGTPPGGGGMYGGGAGNDGTGGYTTTFQGGPGGCRIIWGANRAFPNTNTADM